MLLLPITTGRSHIFLALKHRTNAHTHIYIYISLHKHTHTHTHSLQIQYQGAAILKKYEWHRIVLDECQEIKCSTTTIVSFFLYNFEHKQNITN